VISNIDPCLESLVWAEESKMLKEEEEVQCKDGGELLPDFTEFGDEPLQEFDGKKADIDLSNTVESV